MVIVCRSPLCQCFRASMRDEDSKSHLTSLTPQAFALGVGPLAILALLLWFAGWTGPVPGPGQDSAASDAAWVLMHSAAWPIAWLIAAFGLGWPLRAWLIPNSRFGLS